MPDEPTEPFEPEAGPTRGPPEPPAPPVPPRFSAGEKSKARGLLAAVRTLHAVEREHRPPTQNEQQALANFPGFGPVALSLFPDPATGRYKDAGWQALGEELQSLLSPDEYAAAKRSTFTAFYTSPVVIRAVYAALDRLGVPPDARVLEPGCGSGNFLALAPPSMHATGVELDPTSARIAQARHPRHTVRTGDFRDLPLSATFDAAVGNVPFADLRSEYTGHRLALHDLFLVKALDALAPGGVLAAVTSRYTLDKQSAAARELLADRADFLGAIRLPSGAFKAEGTAVVTDLVFFRKRAAGEPAAHASEDWLGTAPLALDGATVAVNRYFLTHPEVVLGTWNRQDTLYGTDGFSVTPTGELADQLPAAVARLPALPRRERTAVEPAVEPSRHTPPLDDPLPEAEGSFFVGADRRIYQRRDGRAEPVTYGGRELTATGTLVGKRLAALVGLRDLARTVLRAQTDDWAEGRRQAARRDLNHAYDRFALAYGAVNTTTFSETADGTVARRTPNLVKFREDPDAMLVMALEEYDEVTGRAAKAPVLLRDVVGPTPPVTRVESAEAGLLVSLDRTGRVDLPLIAELYGRPEADVLRELGDLAYRDPATGTLETADAYLSGNVRVKLAQAEAAGPAFARHADALRAVQPEDVLPGDIDANLGTPWIPAEDVRQFAAELFRVPASSVQVAHLPADAVWSVEGDFAGQRSVAATSEFGTPRAGGFWLLEQALNLKTPTIYDTVGDTRVANPEATLAARDKQAAIKDRFRQWVFADPDRTERLVRAYNDAYNATRLRQFDGSHLRFPGMTAGVTLRPHQTDAAWRCMSGGNTLLAHCVGAGKTYTMAAAGMKLRQAGLARKPMYVVPNHLLEQFAREFLHLYPTARLLVAGKDDLTKDRRKLLTAQIATGDWDGIVVTHSSFERIGLSQAFQAAFLREQIAEYDRLLADRACARPSQAHRNVIKTIEKQKARREERLKQLLAADKKDDGLVFDELGVDHLFVDEAHAFKNLETPTKMERVAGVQTGGSDRAFDLLMKCQYLHRKNRGRGVTFATGTPVSNTMVELYTLQRYLDPDGLAAAGIAHFDAWAAAFGEVVDAMEVARTDPPSARGAGSPSSSTCPNSSRCSASSPTCRPRTCWTCRGRPSPATSRRWSPARCRTRRRTCSGGWWRGTRSCGLSGSTRGRTTPWR